MIYLPPFRGFIRAFSIVCGIVFITQMLLAAGPLANADLSVWMLRHLGLTPEKVFSGEIWQIFTWVFLHGDFLHLLFNILGLWMFGSSVESLWGKTRFRHFCLISGVATGLCICLFGLVHHETYISPTIGASGIVFACIMAVSVLFPNQIVLFFFVFPMKMKYFAYLMVAIEFYTLWSAQTRGISSSVSTIGHLSGAVVGYLIARGGGGGLSLNGLQWFKNWKERVRYHRMRKRLRVVKTETRIRYN